MATSTAASIVRSMRRARAVYCAMPLLAAAAVLMIAAGTGNGNGNVGIGNGNGNTGNFNGNNNVGNFNGNRNTTNGRGNGHVGNGAGNRDHPRTVDQGDASSPGSAQGRRLTALCAPYRDLALSATHPPHRSRTDCPLWRCYASADRQK